MFVRKKIYDEAIRRIAELKEENLRAWETSARDNQKEIDNIKDLLKDVKKAKRFNEGIVGIWADMTATDGTILTDEYIKNFSEVMDSFIDSLSINERKELRKVCDKFFKKKCKNEKLVRDWDLCFRAVRSKPQYKTEFLGAWSGTPAEEETK